MTPNMEKLPDVLKNPKSPLIERVEIIRKLAKEKHCCLADTYLVWEKFEAEGQRSTLFPLIGGCLVSFTMKAKSMTSTSQSSIYM